jgi:superfamily II DNA or RNA helicase/intein/homing endonuclease
MGAVPRTYQQEAIDAGVTFFKSKEKGHGLLILPTGSGKSVIIANIAAALDEKIIVFVPSKEILEQNLSKFLSYGYRAGVYSASAGMKFLDHITFATIGSVVSKPHILSKFKHIIIDECFPAGSQIDGKPIEEINIGDVVRSFNHETGSIENKKVVRLFRKKVSAKLLNVTFSDGSSFICTDNHPIYTNELGYIPAIQLTLCKHIKLTSIKANAQDNNTALSDLRGRSQEKGSRKKLPSSMFAGVSNKIYVSKTRKKDNQLLKLRNRDSNRAVPENKFHKNRKGILLYRMWQVRANGSVPSFWTRVKSVDRISTKRFRANEGKQPNVDSRRERKDDRINEGSDVSFKRRKRTTYTSANDTSFSYRFSYGIPDRNSICKKLISISTILLQGRSRLGRKKDCNRSGRTKPQIKKVEIPRCEEDRNIECVRVESVEVYEQRDRSECKESREDNYVYNIEVEDNHNYFVSDILVHNCHLVNPEEGMYIKVIKYLEHAKVVGLTATPYRLSADFEGCQLKFVTRTRPKVFNKILYYIQNKQLFDQGYLAKLEYFPFNVVDRSQLEVNKSGSDFTDASVKQYYRKIDLPTKIVEYSNRLLKVRPNLLVFCTLVEEAERISERIPGSVVVHGGTEPNTRAKILKQFKSGIIKCVVNVGVLTCLSEETEVLTRRGWLKKDEVTLDDYVAQYEKGEISFEKPTHKHEHRHKGEMVSVNGRYVSFNVTSDHDMLVKTSVSGEFMKVKASKIVGRKVYIPVSGFCNQETLKVDQDISTISKSRFLAQNSYSYRKGGSTKDKANKDALKQWELKSSRLYKNPNELTLEECRLIGFWVGDGCCFDTKGNGKRYSLTQSLRTPKQIEWIRNLLSLCNVDYNEQVYKGKKECFILGRSCNVSGHIVFNLSIGTGGNNQNRRGIYSLLPYLKKEGTELLWGFSRDQYFALMEGLFKADGWHGDNKDYNGGKIVGEYKSLFDLLQAIGVCRGFRVTIKPTKIRENSKKQLYNLSLCDKQQHQMTNTRPTSKSCIDMPVWCLTMSKGTLITRHKGTVTIMGNTGFDFPALSTVLIGKSTMSLALYYQIIGRIMRPHPDKLSGWVVDLGGNIQKFGKIETMTIEFDDAEKPYISNNGRQLTNVVFTKS